MQQMQALLASASGGQAEGQAGRAQGWGEKHVSDVE